MEDTMVNRYLTKKINVFDSIKEDVSDKFNLSKTKKYLFAIQIITFLVACRCISHTADFRGKCYGRE